jgi:hypothetical protein
VWVGLRAAELAELHPAKISSRLDRHPLSTPEQQPCERNTGNKDENVPDLAKENFRQD